MTPAKTTSPSRRTLLLAFSIGLVGTGVIAVAGWNHFRNQKTTGSPQLTGPTQPTGSVPTTNQVQRGNYQPRITVETSGFAALNEVVQPWGRDATLAEISEIYRDLGRQTVERIEQKLAAAKMPLKDQIDLLFMKSQFLSYDGEPQRSYQVLEEIRSIVESDSRLREVALYTFVYLEGVTALRIGENDNCIMCRGETSCIIPIAKAAVHTKPEGSRLAIQHFTEYLDQFPDDLEVRWLLNVAHMTLGEHPQKVNPKYLISLDRFQNSEFDIGKFRDIGHLLGVNRFNQAGGAVMEDFDGDGLLDIVVTSFDPAVNLDFYRNTGDGTFENCTESAGLTGQLGGLNCVQTDYNNDGHMDIFVIRGAWIYHPIRPSLLRNNGDRTFTDVTEESGLLDPINSISAAWSDYDNDGWLDLFICGERQPNRLYHNQRDGTFEEVAAKAGVQLANQSNCKGAAWIDYDNDGAQDLYLNYLTMQNKGQLFHNNRDGTFQEVTTQMGLDGPIYGFSCWAFDYNNDGWLDIFATCYDRTLADVVKGIQGVPHDRKSNRLYLNQQGQRFQDVTKEAGLDLVFSTMGSNYGDFDNDGFLDMYLGTGEPSLATLVPNRMFKNVAGNRFSEITASSGTGHLQKGHGISCGDWDRDGNIDIFEQMGGATNGDRYHNIMFQNPGHDHQWITLKLIGQKTNRAAIGARIKVVTSSDDPLTVHRHVSSGSSFGANPLQQTIGLGKTDRIARLEIHWPTSGTTQTFQDIAVNQSLEVTEFAENYRTVDWKPIQIPKRNPEQ